MRKWCEEHLLDLKDLVKEEKEPEVAGGSPYPCRRIFGYTVEDLRDILTPMAENGKEPIGAMGMDSPLAVLSEAPKLLYDYFQQNFAQVTNPPIDGVRERIVTSSAVVIGNMANIMESG